MVKILRRNQKQEHKKNEIVASVAKESSTQESALIIMAGL